jgi:Protein of unknown function (DUF3237)
MIELRHVADIVVMVGNAIEIGATASGVRRVIPILGGEAFGPRLKGRILAGGADFQTHRKDGVIELDARYVIESENGSRILVQNSGLRHGPVEAMERLVRGEEVDPALIYFRTSPRFETGDDTYRWLMRYVFTGSAIRRPDRVELSVYQVM